MSKWAKYLTKWKTWWKREDGWKMNVEYIELCKILKENS